MTFFKSRLRWASYPLVIITALVIIYGFGRLIHVSMDSLYHGERAPYLQLATPTGIQIHWQTTQREIGLVRYGLHPEKLDFQQVENTATEIHMIQLQKLKPATRYYYSVGSKEKTFRGGKDYWFETPPRHGTTSVSRFWVLGDPGMVTTQQARVRDAALNWLHQHPRTNKQGAKRPYLDLMFTTGDNAYRSGANEEFQIAFFQPYESILRNIPVWPIYGNHDARRWAFFDLFSFPEQGEVGGVPSQSEHYFSFDYANVHFVVLDSHETDRSRNGVMARWLRKDLAAHQQDWLITLFHHPPYTKGSHDSDDRRDSWGRMAEMRENILPILEQAGVDLVFSGHSHMYERSYLLNCHYATSDKLAQENILSRDHKNYTKRSKKPAAYEGTIYAVVGSSARADYGPLNHPVMATSLQETGSMIIDVDGLKLHARFITGDGLIADEFMVTKGIKTATAGHCN